MSNKHSVESYTKLCGLICAVEPFIKIGQKLEGCNNLNERPDSQVVWGVDGSWLTIGHFRNLVKEIEKWHED